MTAATPKKLKSLRDFLATKPHQETLRSYLRHAEVGLLRDAFLVTLHRNWSSHPPFELTELGITTYDRRSVNHGRQTTLGPHAENIFRNMWSLHLRIRSSAHLPATTEANAFHFGTTVFVSQEEALELLHEIWHQPMDENGPEEGLRPVLYMHFGDNDGLGKMRKAQFGFDPTSFSTNVAVLDAQHIPLQAKITRSDIASLMYLSQLFKITPFDCWNAGNAAMYATIIAVLSTLRNEVYQSMENPRAKPGQVGQSASKSAQSVIQWLMERPTPAPPFGVMIYCRRCGSGSHEFPDCPNSDLSCSRCEMSVHAWRRANAGTHIEGLCTFRR